MSQICAFVVYGDAKPQGSTRTRTFRNAKGQMRTVITHSNRESLMQWRQDIRAAIQAQVPQLASVAVATGPIAVRVRFAITKPPSVSKRRVFPIVAPDLDRLIRAVGDALTSTVMRDDAQIVHWDCWKVYTDGRAEALIEIWQPDVVLPMAIENPFHQPGLF